MSTTEDVDAVEAVNQALYSAVEEADLDAMGELWADGSLAESTVCVHPGWPPVVGRGPVLRSWALVMAGTPYVQFFLTDVRTEVLGDVGIVTCAENILTEVDPADGGGLSGGRVVATNIFRRTPLGWRVWVHHASPVLPVVADQVEGGDS